MATIIQQPQIVSALQPKQMNMKVKAVRGLGITQIVVGALTFLLGIIISATVYGNWATGSGSGIWSGLWFIAAGVFGVVSSCYPKNSCWNTTHMVFCIFSTVFSSISSLFIVIALSWYSSCDYVTYNFYYQDIQYWTCGEDPTKAKILFGILLILSFAVFIVALVSAVFCCQANGCCCSSSHPGVIVANPQRSHTTTVIAPGYQAPVYTTQPAYTTQQQHPFYPTQQQQPSYPPQQQQPFYPPQQQQPYNEPLHQKEPYPPQNSNDLPPSYNP